MTPDQQRMNLHRAPLMHLQVASDPQNQQWYVLLQIHHLVCDHESLELVMSEVKECLQGHAQELPLPLSYRIHVAQTLEHLRTHDAKSFFREKLGDIDETTAPFGLVDIQGNGSKVQEASGQLSAELGKRIREQARRLG